MQDLIDITEDVGGDELEALRIRRDTAAAATAEKDNKDMMEDKKCKKNKHQ